MDEEDTNNKTNSEYYSKREIDSKIQKLDNLIYKLEQRIELIERNYMLMNFRTQNPISNFNVSAIFFISITFFSFKL